ncbi:MAG: deoxyribonuclease V [Kiloniellaceae bacterium]
MKILRQSWPRSAREARALQERLRGRVVAQDRLGPVRLVGGVDASHRPGNGLTRAAAALLSFPGLALQTWTSASRPTDFPYVPGLLSLREAPAILDALRRLPEAPDLLLVDGQGLAHPRRFGIACHIGVLADVPTIGVTKSRLVGHCDEPGGERGRWAPLLDDGEVIGAAVRTRAETRPVFVSVGHRICLETAIELVLRCAPRYRLPEPIRQADRLSRP